MPSRPSTSQINVRTHAQTSPYCARPLAGSHGFPVSMCTHGNEASSSGSRKIRARLRLRPSVVCTCIGAHSGRDDGGGPIRSQSSAYHSDCRQLLRESMAAASPSVFASGAGITAPVTSESADELSLSLWRSPHSSVERIAPASTVERSTAKFSVSCRAGVYGIWSAVGSRVQDR